MEQLLNPGTLIFLIPIVAIIGSFIVKLRKMELERGDGVNDEVLRSVQREIIQLKRRMENIETIITSEEPENKTVNSNHIDSEKSEDLTNDNRLKNMLR